MTKEEARKRMREVRRNFVGRQRALAEEKAKEFMLDYIREVNPSYVFPFVSHGTEIDTVGLIKDIFINFPDIVIAVPKVEGEQMQFYRLESVEDLKPGTMGILEPMGGEPLVIKEGILLMPGLAFDRQGNRAGYGAGYYDRYLEGIMDTKVQPVTENENTIRGVLKIGYAFSFQLIESLQCESHDVPLDAVLTEGGICWF